MKKITLMSFILMSLCSMESVFGFERVSIINLIVNPEKYVEKSIRVKGYYYISVNNGLFVSKKAAEMFDLPSSIEVIDESESAEMTTNCHDRHVEIEGVLHLNEDNNYELKGVTSIFDFDKEEYCWKKSQSE